MIDIDVVSSYLIMNATSYHIFYARPLYSLLKYRLYHQPEEHFSYYLLLCTWTVEFALRLQWMQRFHTRGRKNRG